MSESVKRYFETEKYIERNLKHKEECLKQQFPKNV